MAMDQLSQRENEVFELAALGLSNDEIAARLEISRRTVETHLRTVFHKTGVSRRSQLATLAGGGGRPAAEPASGAAGLSAAGRVPERPGTPPEADARRTELYSAALRQLVDRQFPLFEESVELTMIVGENDGQDSVVERRRTVPKPYLVYRVLRPIVAATGGAPDPDDLVLMCDVHGKDVHADVSAVIEDHGFPMALVLFQPGLQEPTEWTLRYRSPGLWNPLREHGTDTLEWATATLDRRHRPTLDAVTLSVVYPAGWTDVGLVEGDDRGSRHTERMPTGQTRITWRDSSPVAAAYHWRLDGRPA